MSSLWDHAEILEYPTLKQGKIVWEEQFGISHKPDLVRGGGVSLVFVIFIGNKKGIFQEHENSDLFMELFLEWTKSSRKLSKFQIFTSISPNLRRSIESLVQNWSTEWVTINSLEQLIEEIWMACSTYTCKLKWEVEKRLSWWHTQTSFICVQ